MHTAQQLFDAFTPVVRVRACARVNLHGNVCAYVFSVVLQISVFPTNVQIMSTHGVGSESASHSETGDTSRDLRDILYERLVNDGQLAHIKVSACARAQVTHRPLYRHSFDMSPMKHCSNRC